MRSINQARPWYGLGVVEHGAGQISRYPVSPARPLVSQFTVLGCVGLPPQPPPRYPPSIVSRSSPSVMLTTLWTLRIYVIASLAHQIDNARRPTEQEP